MLVLGPLKPGVSLVGSRLPATGPRWKIPSTVPAPGTGRPPRRAAPPHVFLSEDTMF